MKEYFSSEESIFGVMGLHENEDYYSAVVGVYDYFWALKAETRIRIIEEWISALEYYLEADVEEMMAETEIAEGNLVVSEAGAVEEKTAKVKEFFTNNVVPFRRKD